MYHILLGLLGFFVVILGLLLLVPVKESLIEPAIRNYFKRRRDQYPFEVQFYVVENLSFGGSVWDEVLDGLPGMPSLPQGYPRRRLTQPRGDWRVVRVSHEWATARAYEEAGFAEPQLTELPALIAVWRFGRVEMKARVRAEQAIKYINDNVV